MSEELKLGFHRLAARLEDPVNLGLGIGLLWAICAWLIGVAFAMSFLQVLLMVVAGVAALLLLRGEVSATAARMSRSHERLEQSDTGAAA